MKTLKLPDELLRDFEGKSLDATLKQAYLRMMNFTKMAPENAVEAPKIAAALVGANGSVDLEDHHFKLLREIVKENQPGWPAPLQAPMLQAFADAELRELAEKERDAKESKSR